MKHKKSRHFKVTAWIIAFALLLPITGIAYAAFQAVPDQNSPLIFSNKDMLQDLWSGYKSTYIENGTYRTLDRQQNDITTSEGQSYTMLRAVWIDDQDTFDKSWKWTKDNLQRKDYLMSWKFGERPDGTYGIQTDVGGQNTATDGDSDIAYSLLMAYSRWKNDDYLYDALPIIDSIWKNEVVMVNNQPVLVSNDLEKLNSVWVLVNPSYLSPYAYRAFARADPTHDWNGLISNSYNILHQVSDNALGASNSVGLPPDWIWMDRTNGEIRAAPYPNLKTDFSFDALRTPWRLALDYKWYGDQRAKDVLAKYGYLSQKWYESRQLKGVYAHNGQQLVDYETPAFYGGTLGYFDVIDPEAAKNIYNDKIVTQYNPDTQRFRSTLSYYDDNWTWFGMALHLNELPNLTQNN